MSALVPGLEFAMAVARERIAHQRKKIAQGQCRTRYAEYEAQAIMTEMNALLITLRQACEGNQFCPLPQGYAWVDGKIEDIDMAEVAP